MFNIEILDLFFVIEMALLENIIYADPERL